MGTSIVLFVIGVMGVVLNRRNLLIMLMLSWHTSILTSRLENWSFSINSATPSSSDEGSAYATPNTLLPFSTTNLTAIIVKDVETSKLPNSTSSNCCKFPGEA